MADAAPAPAPAPRRTHRRISVGKELKLLLRQGFLILVGEQRNLIISLLFPILAAIVTVWIAGEYMFITNEGTKSACFVLVCASIWGGLFNSIQIIVKERSNIKRDYVSGALRIECYMGSRAMIQLILCLIQSLILALSVPMAEMFWEDVEVPSAGLFGLPIFLEFFFSLFLIMLASDALGLLISSFVKKEEVASKLAPYVLIAQLLFSGFLFTIEEDSPAIVLSYLMISRWGIGALGSICDLNNLPRVDYLNCLNKNEEAAICPCGTLEQIHYPKEDSLYTATSEHLVLMLLIMIAFVAVSLVAADLLLHRVKKDGRE